MNSAERVLLSWAQGVNRLDAAMDPAETARLFVLALVMQTACEGLREQHWLLTQDVRSMQPVFDAYMKRIWSRELTPLKFLAPALQPATPSQLRAVRRGCAALCEQIVRQSFQADEIGYRRFVREGLRAMTELAMFFERLVTFPDRPAFSLYRTFDAMDEIFQLQYQRDQGMASSPTERERLYEGAGSGVQTSYASILCALENLHLQYGAHLVDLGSGYGRVGLTAGLWREDVRFSGYEFVGHRVGVARCAAARAGLEPRVQFHQRDLARFPIPPADVYYLYDPFCEATYARVLDQLRAHGRRRAIAVVTKGGAGERFLNFARQGGWEAPESYDLGTLLVFRSAQPGLMTRP